PQDVPRVEADKARPFLIEDDPRNQPADRDDESIQAAGAVAAPAPVSTEQTATSAVVTLDGTLPLPSLVGELLPPEEVCIANAAEAEKDQTEGRPDRAHVQVAGAAEPTMLGQEARSEDTNPTATDGEQVQETLAGDDPKDEKADDSLASASEPPTSREEAS